jgi:hypothetical protein
MGTAHLGVISPFRLMGRGPCSGIAHFLVRAVYCRTYPSIHNAHEREGSLARSHGSHTRTPYSVILCVCPHSHPHTPGS